MSAAASRRRFLGLSAAGVGAAASAALGIDWQLSGPRSVGALVRSTARLPEPFTTTGVVPPVIVPAATADGIDRYVITQRRARVEILPGLLTEIWGYNGIFPGPTILARSGTTAVVTHRNELDVPVAVHLHGGHTPASSDGYPTDLIMPVDHGHGVAASGHHDGQADITHGVRDYTYPNLQPASTLWYHDHRMDFTAPAIWRGLAGFHLVTDEVEESLSLPSGVRDMPLMIADRSFAADGSLVYPANDPTMSRTPGVTGDFVQGVLGDVVLVNGRPWPRYDVDAARYRLRWLNGSNARNYRLRLESPHRAAPGFVQIGSDGGLLDKPQELDAIDIAPAERFDTVLDLTGYRVGDEVNVVNDLGDATTIPVLRLRVTGTGPDSSRLPDVLAPFKRLERARAVRIRDFDFRHGQVRPMGGHHGDVRGWLVNGQPFDPSRADAVVKLGELEIWRLTANFNHPIHIHLNPFQVLTRNRGEPAATDRGWKDTINLAAGEVAELAVEFTNYVGRFLIHCHNLEHEDMAMMANFQVIR